MKRKQLSLAIHGVLAVSLLASVPVMAQEAPATDAGGQKTTTLEGIKVTARKREETLQEVPVAVTAHVCHQPASTWVNATVVAVRCGTESRTRTTPVPCCR